MYEKVYPFERRRYIEEVMIPKIPYVIYFIGVLILVLPAFLATNANKKVFFRNIAIWGIIFLILIFCYQIFNN